MRDTSNTRSYDRTCPWTPIVTSRLQHLLRVLSLFHQGKQVENGERQYVCETDIPLAYCKLSRYPCDSVVYYVNRHS